MKTEKKLTIKIKSKTERRIMEPEVEMITEWNIKRIVIALLVLLLVIVIPAYYLSRSDDGAGTNTNNIEKDKTIIPSAAQQKLKPELLQNKRAQKTVEKSVVITMEPSAEPAAAQLKLDVLSASKDMHSKGSIETVNLNEPVLLHENITRAQFALGMHQREPFGQVELPLVVNKERASGIFYFTEVINMKGETVFHEWLFQDKVAYKRKFNIQGDRWRIATSKLFDTHYIGAWQVRVITKEGIVLHKVDFIVQ